MQYPMPSLKRHLLKKFIIYSHQTNLCVSTFFGFLLWIPPNVFTLVGDNLLVFPLYLQWVYVQSTAAQYRMKPSVVNLKYSLRKRFRLLQSQIFLKPRMVVFSWNVTTVCRHELNKRCSSLLRKLQFTGASSQIICG